MRRPKRAGGQSFEVRLWPFVAIDQADRLAHHLNVCEVFATADPQPRILAARVMADYRVPAFVIVMTTERIELQIGVVVTAPAAPSDCPERTVLNEALRFKPFDGALL